MEDMAELILVKTLTFNFHWEHELVIQSETIASFDEALPSDYFTVGLILMN